MNAQSTAAREGLVATLELAALPARRGARLAARAHARSEAQRLLLEGAARLGVTAQGIAKRASGAPYLIGAPELGVSLAHCDGWAAATATRAAAIGVDVERIVLGRDRAALAAVVLDAGTRLSASASPAAASRALHLCWALREAIGKATGGGIWDGVDAIALHCDPAHDDLPVAWSPRRADSGAAWWLGWSWLGPDGVLALAVRSAEEPWAACRLPPSLSLKTLRKA